MAIQSVLDTLDGVDEALKPHYVEDDGKFHLDLGDTARDHRDVQALRKAYDSEKEAGKTAKAAAQKAKDDLAAALKEKPDEAALLAERSRYENRITELEGKLTEADGKLIGVTRDQAFKSALAGAGITDPFYVDLLTAKHADEVKMVDGAAKVDSGMGPEDVAAWAKKQAAGPWQKAVTPPAGGGSKGNPGGGSPNKKPDEMSAQDRAALFKSNPAEFYRLFPHAKPA